MQKYPCSLFDSIGEFSSIDGGLLRFVDDDDNIQLAFIIETDSIIIETDDGGEYDGTTWKVILNGETTKLVSYGSNENEWDNISVII
jgi:hypothetical protein